MQAVPRRLDRPEIRRNRDNPNSLAKRLARYPEKALAEMMLDEVASYHLRRPEDPPGYERLEVWRRRFQMSGQIKGE